jgi:hypothetical protein
MPGSKKGDEAPEQKKFRIEMSWHENSRELDDLARVAERTRGNPQRRGEASAYVIRLWSQVLHGELSASAFWEMFGVAATTPALPAGQQSAPVPASREVYSPPTATQEAPQREERRANREKNRAAAADQWGN